jgi:hypothetical protein
MAVRGLTSAPVRKSFRAIGVPSIQKRPSRDGYVERETPGWLRLKKHIDKHEKAGGLAQVTTMHLDDPVMVEGRLVVEFKNVELLWTEPD